MISLTQFLKEHPPLDGSPCSAQTLRPRAVQAEWVAHGTRGPATALFAWRIGQQSLMHLARRYGADATMMLLEEVDLREGEPPAFILQPARPIEALNPPGWSIADRERKVRAQAAVDAKVEAQASKETCCSAGHLRPELPGGVFASLQPEDWPAEMEAAYREFRQKIDAWRGMILAEPRHSVAPEGPTVPYGTLLPDFSARLSEIRANLDALYDAQESCLRDWEYGRAAPRLVYETLGAAIADLWDNLGGLLDDLGHPTREGGS